MQLPSPWHWSPSSKPWPGSPQPDPHHMNVNGASSSLWSKRSLCVHAQLLSCVWLFATAYTVACQVPLSMGILQARILEWVAMPFFRRSPLSRWLFLFKPTPPSPQLRAGTPSLQCSGAAELRDSWTKRPWNGMNPPTTMHRQCDQSDGLSTFPCSSMRGGCYTLPWPCLDAGTSEFMCVKTARSGPSGSGLEPGHQPLRTHASGVERLPSFPQHCSSWARSMIGAEKQGIPTWQRNHG